LFAIAARETLGNECPVAKAVELDVLAERFVLLGSPFRLPERWGRRRRTLGRKRARGRDMGSVVGEKLRKIVRRLGVKVEIKPGHGEGIELSKSK
jgi:hypothetical protein